MAAAEIDPVDLLVEVIRDNTPEDIWGGSPLIAYRFLGNTNRGEIGEEFIRRFLKNGQVEVGNGHRASDTDISIKGHPVEVKTASLGSNGTFQFNHVRLDKRYTFLICLGICPSQVVFEVWRKGDVAEEKAGRLVPMAAGASTTLKLTKKLADLRPIQELLPWAHSLPEKE